MPRDYAKIRPKFWDSGIVSSSETDDIYTAHVALYLMTSPASTMYGLFRCSAAQIADDTHISMPKVELALSELERADFLERDQRRKLVYVKKMAAHQIEPTLKASDGRVSSIKKDLATVVDCPLKASFISDYNILFNLGFSDNDIEMMRNNSPPLYPPLNPPLGGQEQEQEQEQRTRAGAKNKNTEQEPRALRSQAEDQDQEQKPKACAAEPLAASAAVSLENLEDENLNSDSTTDAESATHDLSKKAVSKRAKAQKSTVNGIDLSSLPQKISVMAAETLIAHRKAKRSPFVQVSFDRFMVKVLEASAELSISADDVIFEMIDAGWTGFRTDWLKNRLQSGQKTGGNFGRMSESEKGAARKASYADFLDDFGGVNPVTGAVLIEDIEYAKL